MAIYYDNIMAIYHVCLVMAIYVNNMVINIIIYDHIYIYIWVYYGNNIAMDLQSTLWGLIGPKIQQKKDVWFFLAF